MLTSQLPASGAFARCSRYTASFRCILELGHDGTHVIASAGVTPTQRYRDHGIIHRVAWFDYRPSNWTRYLWTVCGQHYKTKNRTPRNSYVLTCMECIACP